ncbi:MAG TPA: LLM class flavin-dependent oxidoreductase [Aliicoccus persicus]|uniref:LLM class flavin-dependent oxidoreductase n=1 Tax=Aliicoccus persicus TaxID=930138 RepID=A0A921B5S4_9STAP|nr:LLM class flavin-dependent oxidoreductase [Aliicoccus persicus]
MANRIDLKLSILDIGTKLKDNSVTTTLQNMTERVQLADSLGFTRYWFAEHHNSPNQVSTSPEVMIAHAAAHTKQIRIGAGGIMMPNHSPLKVVENFSILEGLHPGRIDLGIGRATGTDPMTSLALRRSLDAVKNYNFDDQFYEMLHFYNRDFPGDHKFRYINAVDKKDNESLMSKIFMLGSSDGGVKFAMKEGLGFVFAAHINPEIAVTTLKEYRKNFQPSESLTAPKGIYSIIVITAATDEEAAYQAGPVELYWARIQNRDTKSPFPTLEEAANHEFSSAERTAIKYNKDRFVIGSIQKVAKKLREIAEAAMVDEIMIMEAYADTEASKKAFRLLANEFELK